MRLSDSLRLFCNGTAALARVSRNGFKIDRDYFTKSQETINQETTKLKDRILNETEIGRAWKQRYGDMLNLKSGHQFKVVLESDIGFTDFKVSEKGNKSADQEVIRKLPHDFSSLYIPYKQLEQAYRTFVTPILRECSEDGYVHADFLLDGVRTYRGSCRSPNLQQQPKRNKMLMRLIRTGFIPRASNRVLLDLDLKGAECAIGACVHLDPAMIAYVTDDTLDMHRDGAMRVFMLEKEQVSKDVRNACKGDFTFAEFYGATFNTVAPALWEHVIDPDIRIGDGMLVYDHLKSCGITCLDSFTAHIKRVEQQFWGEMFKGYADWKERVWEEYLEKGYIKTRTGFYLTQESTKEQILNAPVQGPSFHFLLYILIKMSARMIRYKMDSKIIAQIHDAIIFDAVPEEIDQIRELYWECQDDVRKEWDWIIVPLRAEMEMSNPGGSWAEMTEIGFVERGGL